MLGEITIDCGSLLSRNACNISLGRRLEASYISICGHFYFEHLKHNWASLTCKYCRCSSKIMILFHLSAFNRIDLRVYSWMNSTLRSLSPILGKNNLE